jgi:hypothetical protein
MNRNAPRSIVVATAVLLAMSSAACAGEPPRESVAQPWTRNGEPVSIDVIESHDGSAHCEWEKARFLQVAFPILSELDRRPRSNQYVRDPEGVLGDGSLGRALRIDATLPADAKPTGYSREGTELWLAESDREQTAYLVTGNPRKVEAWPRADPPFGCD